MFFKLNFKKKKGKTLNTINIQNRMMASSTSKVTNRTETDTQDISRQTSVRNQANEGRMSM